MSLARPESACGQARCRDIRAACPQCAPPQARLSLCARKRTRCAHSEFCCISPSYRDTTRSFASDLHGKHSSTKSELQPPGGHRRGGLETLLPSLRTLSRNSRAAGTQSCPAIKLCVGSQHISPRSGTLKGGCDAISNLGPISSGNDSARIRRSDSDNWEKAPVSARSIDPAWAGAGMRLGSADCGCRRCCHHAARTCQRCRKIRRPRVSWHPLCGPTDRGFALEATTDSRSLAARSRCNEVSRPLRARPQPARAPPEHQRRLLVLERVCAECRG